MLVSIVHHVLSSRNINYIAYADENRFERLGVINQNFTISWYGPYRILLDDDSIPVSQIKTYEDFLKIFFKIRSVE
ncbi:MAG TPA: hypothetical protein PK390_06135 [Fervidobacterium nodosum]|nr:hypothetical protein [Fervidobacterium nodosum]